MADPWLTREEYVALHQEMRGAMAELARLERACVLGVAALFAWLVRGAGDYVGYQGLVWFLSLIHISEPTRHLRISYAVFCL